jgi:hypothetical protein
MKRIAIAAAATLALALAACQTTPTPYQPLGAPGATVSGGFTDQRLDETHFRVTFRGNDLTSRERVETFMLYRAAELTVSQGFDWFEMAHRDTENRGGAFITGSGFGGGWSPYWRFRGAAGWGAWGWGDPFWDSYDVQRINEYEAIAEIAMGHGPPPTGRAGAFDARQVLANLGPKIVRPAEAAAH